MFKKLNLITIFFVLILNSAEKHKLQLSPACSSGFSKDPIENIKNYKKWVLQKKKLSMNILIKLLYEIDSLGHQKGTKIFHAFDPDSTSCHYSKCESRMLEKGIKFINNHKFNDAHKLLDSINPVIISLENFKQKISLVIEYLHDINRLNELLAIDFANLFNYLPPEMSQIILSNLNPFQEIILDGHNSELRCVIFSPDGKKVIAGGLDHEIKIWDLETETFKELVGHTHGVNSLAISADGSKIISGSYDKTVRVWDANSCIEIAQYTGAESVMAVAISPDGTKVIAASCNGSLSHKELYIWDLQTNELKKRNINIIYSLNFSPDGSQVIWGDNHSGIYILNLQTNKVSVLQGHTHIVMGIVFSADGSKIASCAAMEDGTVRIWDATTFKCEKIFELRHTQTNTKCWINSVAFSPDGTKIVTGCASPDSKIRIWDIESGKCIKILDIVNRDYCYSTEFYYDNCIAQVAFSPDGLQIVSATKDGKVRIWDIFSETLSA